MTNPDLRTMCKLNGHPPMWTPPFTSRPKPVKCPCGLITHRKDYGWTR